MNSWEFSYKKGRSTFGRFRLIFEKDTVALLSKVLIVAACLLLPIIWGVVVNWLFNFWNNRATRHDDEEEPIFPDYQI